MNRNQGLFWSGIFANRVKGRPNIKFQCGKDIVDANYEFKATEITTECTVYIFAPELVGEQWEIFMARYGGKPASDWFEEEAICWAKKFGTKVIYCNDDWLPDPNA